MSALAILAPFCLAVATAVNSDTIQCPNAENGQLTAVDVVDKLGVLFHLSPVSVNGIHALEPPGPMNISGTIRKMNNNGWCGMQDPFAIGEMRVGSVAHSRGDWSAFGVSDEGFLVAAAQLQEFDNKVVVWKSPVIAIHTKGGTDVVFYRDADWKTCFYWYGTNDWKNDVSAIRGGEVTFGLKWIGVREACEFHDQPWSVEEAEWFNTVAFGGSPEETGPYHGKPTGPL